LGKEGDPLHPAGALGAFQNVDAKHHLEQLSPWGPAAVATLFSIFQPVAADVSYGFATHGKEAPTKNTKRHQEHQRIQFLKVQVLVSLVLFLVNLVEVLLLSY